MLYNTSVPGKSAPECKLKPRMWNLLIMGTVSDDPRDDSDEERDYVFGENYSESEESSDDEPRCHHLHALVVLLPHLLYLLHGYNLPMPVQREE